MTATISKSKDYVEIKVGSSTYLFHAEQYAELVEAIKEAEED